MKDHERNHCYVNSKDGKLVMYRNNNPDILPLGGDSFGGFLF